ncbi:hypothetical protein QYE76_046837 [Lolium multiflorum]|uniref:CCHC-type domain-containing protein n=1 Tax=Lolium multiflorum TaxID=4521 RepID=A0AAD8TMR9_LOLMU|nr:hypothetical protein QYE76_046837 [Lolium multiflorum]
MPSCHLIYTNTSSYTISLPVWDTFGIWEWDLRHHTTFLGCDKWDYLGLLVWQREQLEEMHSEDELPTSQTSSTTRSHQVGHRHVGVTSQGRVARLGHPATGIRACGERIWRDIAHSNTSTSVDNSNTVAYVAMDPIMARHSYLATNGSTASTYVAMELTIARAADNTSCANAFSDPSSGAAYAWSLPAAAGPARPLAWWIGAGRILPGGAWCARLEPRHVVCSMRGAVSGGAPRALVARWMATYRDSIPLCSRLSLGRRLCKNLAGLLLRHRLLLRHGLILRHEFLLRQELLHHRQLLLVCSRPRQLQLLHSSTAAAGSNMAPPEISQVIRSGQAEAEAAEGYDPFKDPNRRPRRSKDPAWKYAFMCDLEDRLQLQCNLCGKKVGSGVNRMKKHLAGGFTIVTMCPKTTTAIQKEMHDYLKSNTFTFKNVEGGEGEAEQGCEEDVEEIAAGDFHAGATSSRASNCSNTNTNTNTNNSGKRKSDGSAHVANTAAKKQGKSIADEIRKTPEEVVAERHMSKGSQLTMKQFIKKTKEQKAIVDDHVANFLYENCLPLNVVNSRSWEIMLESIGQYGSDYISPSYWRLRVPLLEKAKVKTDVDAKLVAQLLSEQIDAIGPELVVQVVSDNGSNYKAAGRLLMEKYPTLYWRAMKEAMTSRFVPTNYMRNIFDKLTLLRQGVKTVDEYYMEMEMLMQRGRVRESLEMTMQRFLNGLKYDVKGIVRHYTYTNMNQLLHHAREAESQLAEEAKVKGRATGAGRFTPRAPSTAPAPSTRSAPYSTPPSKTVSNASNAKKSESAASTSGSGASATRNRDMLCHTCGGKGHFKRDCPNRKVMFINEDNEYETGDDADPNAPDNDDYDTMVKMHILRCSHHCCVAACS